MSSDGDPGDFDPAEAGGNLQNPENMSKQQSQQTSQSDTGDVQSEKNGQAPGVAINGFGGLYPRMTDTDVATVLSLRNGGITAYRVNISCLECEKRDGTSCEDLEYNCSGQQVCDHLAAAIYQAPRTPDVDLKALDGAISTLSMARDAAESAQNTADSLRAARNAHAQETAANASQNGTADAQADESGGSGYDTDELKGELREAFEYHGFTVNSMDTGTYQGTDQIKFDLEHASFDRLKEVTSECSAVGYDGEMNAVDVGDVKQYISEVLE